MLHGLELDEQVTCIYLFHELPPEVRGQVAKEMARVVKPGGMVVVTDSAQLGDRPVWDKVSITISDVHAAPSA